MQLRKWSSSIMFQEFNQLNMHCSSYFELDYNMRLYGAQLIYVNVPFFCLMWLRHRAHAYPSHCDSRTMVYTTDSSTRLTSHTYYSSTQLFPLVSTVQNGGGSGTRLKLKTCLFWIVNGCINLLVLGHIHSWPCKHSRECKRVVLNRAL